MRLLTTLATSALLASATAQAQPRPEGYLCCNLRSDGAWISDSNYMESGKTVIPLGTPAKVLDFGRYRVMLELPTGKQTLGNDYSRDIAMPAFAARYVIKEDPTLKLQAYPQRVQRAIVSSRVSRGMSREQVLMALGYPMSSENPHLDAPMWKYWLWSFSPFELHFGSNGLVSDVQTDPETRAKVVMD